eukprot:403345391
MSGGSSADIMILVPSQFSEEETINMKMQQQISQQNSGYQQFLQRQLQFNQDHQNVQTQLSQYSQGSSQKHKNVNNHNQNRLRLAVSQDQNEVSIENLDSDSSKPKKKISSQQLHQSQEIGTLNITTTKSPTDPKWNKMTQEDYQTQLQNQPVNEMPYIQQQPRQCQQPSQGIAPSGFKQPKQQLLLQSANNGKLNSGRNENMLLQSHSSESTRTTNTLSGQGFSGTDAKKRRKQPFNYNDQLQSLNEVANQNSQQQKQTEFSEINEENEFILLEQLRNKRETLNRKESSSSNEETKVQLFNNQYIISNDQPGFKKQLTGQQKPSQQLSAYLTPSNKPSMKSINQSQQVIKYLCCICKKERELIFLNNQYLASSFLGKDQICQQCKGSMDNTIQRLNQGASQSPMSSLILSPSAKRLQNDNSRLQNLILSPNSRAFHENTGILSQIKSDNSQSLDQSQSLKDLLPSNSSQQLIQKKQNQIQIQNQLHQNKLALDNIDDSSSNEDDDEGNEFEEYKTINELQQTGAILSRGNSSDLESPQVMIKQNSLNEELQLISQYRLLKQERNQANAQVKNQVDLTSIEENSQSQSLDKSRKILTLNQIDKESSVGSKEEFNCTISETSNISASTDREQVMLNLENVLFIEDRLHLVYERLRSNNYLEETFKIIELCEDWWELLRQEASLFEVYKIFKDEQTQKNLRKSLIIQMIVVSLLGYLLSQEEHQNFIAYFRNLSLYMHQNFLILVQYIMDRFPQEMIPANVWAEQLNKVIKTKVQKKLSKSERLKNLKQNVDILVNILKTINTKALQEKQKKSDPIKSEIYSHQIFQAIADILKGLEKMTFKEAKDIMGKSLREDYSILEQQSAQQNQLRKQAAELASQVQVDNTLALIPSPYVKNPTKMKYTLVLDLDETLLHYYEKNEYEGELRIRPGADEFLRLLSDHYEIMIFTAAMQDYADWALDHFQHKDCISYRLYRQHALPFGGFYVKDLSRIGRDISKMIIVDNIAENFQLQPENGIFIKSWFADLQDTALLELGPLLVSISESNINDVTEALKLFRLHMLEQMAKGIMNPTQHLAQNIKEILKNHTENQNKMQQNHSKQKDEISMLSSRSGTSKKQ